MPILAGAAEANVKETIAACEAYAAHRRACRRDRLAVLLQAERRNRSTPTSREIARHSPIDVTLYNIPMFASPIDVPTVRRLAASSRASIGIKDSSGDLAFMMRMIAAVRPLRPDFCFLTGWDAVLVPMLLIGCDGGTHAIERRGPGSDPQALRPGARRQLEEAMKWQYRILELFDAMLYPFEFPEGFRAAVELRGFRFGRGRQPQTCAQRSDRTALTSVLHCILADFELVDRPGVRMRAAHRTGRPR